MKNCSAQRYRYNIWLKKPLAADCQKLYYVRYWRRKKCTQAETRKIWVTNCKLAAMRIVIYWVNPPHYWGVHYHPNP